MRLRRIEGVVLAAVAVVLVSGASVHATIATLCPSGDSVKTSWENEAPVAECLIGEGAKVCKAWVSTCKKLVRETIKCHVAQAASTAKLEKARCKLDTVADPKQCKQDARDDLKIARARAKNEKGFSTQDCEDYFATCVFDCEI